MMETPSELKRAWKRAKKKADGRLSENDSDIYLQTWAEVYKEIPVAHKAWDAWEAAEESNPDIHDEDEREIRDQACTVVMAATRKAQHWATCAAGEICGLDKVTSPMTVLIEEYKSEEETGGPANDAAHDALRQGIYESLSDDLEKAGSEWLKVQDLGQDFWQQIRDGDVKAAGATYTQLKQILAPYKANILLEYDRLISQSAYVEKDGYDYQ